MFQRPLFICSAIGKCQEKVNCCPHKTPHIKDERCVPRECRYAPGVGDIDCVLHNPDNPAVPEPVPAAPPKTVEQMLQEVKKIEETGEFVPLDQAAKELGIKDAVKKAAQRPVTIVKDQKKAAGKKGKGS